MRVARSTMVGLAVLASYFLPACGSQNRASSRVITVVTGTVPARVMTPTDSRADRACRLVDRRLLDRVFDIGMAGPFSLASQGQGGIACDYSDIARDQSLIIESYGHLTKKQFATEAFLGSPLPSEWKSPIVGIGDQSEGWLLAAAGEAIVAFRVGEKGVVVRVSLGRGATGQVLSVAVAFAEQADRRICTTCLTLRVAASFTCSAPGSALLARPQ